MVINNIIFFSCSNSNYIHESYIYIYTTLAYVVGLPKPMIHCIETSQTRPGPCRMSVPHSKQSRQYGSLYIYVVSTQIASRKIRPWFGPRLYFYSQTVCVTDSSQTETRCTLSSVPDDGYLLIGSPDLYSLFRRLYI